MNYDNEKKKIISKILNLKKGESFTIKSLYDKRWNNFTKGERITLGRMFSSEVHDNVITNVKFLRKGTNGNIYINKCQ